MRLRLGVVFAGALASGAWAQGPSRFDGQYTGELILTNTIRGDCATPPLGALYPLTIAGGEVRFAYAPRFGTTLIGRIADNGIFQASSGARHGRVQMSGRILAGNLSATISSPSCRYAFQTKN